MNTWNIFFILLVAASIGGSYLWLWRINRQVNELVRKNLRKLGFFIVILLIGVACAEEDPKNGISDALGTQPIVLPAEEMQKAGSTIADVIGLQDDLTWWAGALAFLGNNTTTMEVSA